MKSLDELKELKRLKDKELVGVVKVIAQNLPFMENEIGSVRGVAGQVQGLGVRLERLAAEAETLTRAIDIVESFF